MDIPALLRRHRPLLIAAVIGIAFSLTLFFLSRTYENDRFRKAFNERSRDRAQAVIAAFTDHLEQLFSIQSLYLASPRVNRGEFRVFTKNILSNNPDVASLQWVPRVSAAERKGFEEAVRKDGFPAFQITELNPQGKMAVAGQRSVYYPVRYVEPFRQNQNMLGFDVASIAARRSAIARAGERNAAVMLPPLPLQREGKTDMLGQLYLPVYRGDHVPASVSARRKDLAGVVVSTFFISRLVEAAVEPLGLAGVDLFIFNETTPGKREPLLLRWSRMRKAQVSDTALVPVSPEIEYRLPLELGGQKWSIVCRPAPQFVIHRRHWQSWMFLLVGLGITGVTVLYLATLQGRAEKIRQAVRERTADLQRVNEELHKALTAQEIAEQHNRQLAAIVESSDDAIIGNNLQGKIISWNKGAETLYGYSAEEMVGNPVAMIVPEDRQIEIDNFMERINRGETIRHLKTVRRCKDGSHVHVSVSVSPIKDAAGIVAGASTIARDITGEYRREQTLRLLERAITSTSCGILISDPHQPDNPIIFCNRAFETITGYAREEVIGKNCRFLQGADTDEAALKQIREAVAGGGECRVMLKNFRKDGTMFWNQLFITPIKDRNGELTHYIGVQTEVTELKRAEDELRKLTRAVEQSPSSVVITDIEGNIEYVNPVFTTLTGYRFEEVVGKKPSLLKSGEKSPEEYAAMWKTISAGNVWRGEFHNKKKNGDLYWEYASISPVLDKEGKVTNYIAVKEDITERKRIEEQLRSVSTMQKAILDSANFSIISTDAKGIIRTFNAGSERLLGYSAREMIGNETPLKIHDPEEVKKRARELSPDMKPGFEVFVAKAAMGMPEEREWTYIRKDGSRFPVLLSVTALLDKSGNITGYLGIGSDITHRKLAEEAMARAKEAAEAANKAKSEFLATMSHEIRTPMNAIIGMADLLGETTLSAEQSKYVGIFKSAGETLLNLINDILDLSKIESGHITLEKTDFDLYDVVEKATDILAVRAHEKGIELVYDIHPDVPRYLVGDPVRLRQVILKFTDNGEVALEVRKESSDAGTLLFSIRDTGIGIPEDKVNKIFEKFTQADSSTTRKYGGTGLGLAISKRLVKLMGGRIWVTSAVGAGSTFYFTAGFQLQVEKLKAEPVVAPVPEREVLRPLRILLVDDSEDNRLLIRSFLKKTPYVIDTANNGLAAVEQYKTAPYDLILMDIQMPVMDGYAATKEIRDWERSNKREPTPVLALTAYALQEEIRKSYDAGCSGHLTKPIKKNDLLYAIAAYSKKTLGKDQKIVNKG